MASRGYARYMKKWYYFRPFLLPVGWWDILILQKKEYMEEKRIDCANQTAEELALAAAQTQTAFRLNHTMPMTEEYDRLLHELFPSMGEGARVMTPITVVRAHEVKIGERVIIMPGCLMMAAGGITIDDDAHIAANAQLISNNHDLDNRMEITCRPVHIGRRVWIGAGATILPGVTVGDNSVVGGRQRSDPRCACRLYRGRQPRAHYTPYRSGVRQLILRKR